MPLVFLNCLIQWRTGGSPYVGYIENCFSAVTINFTLANRMSHLGFSYSITSYWLPYASKFSCHCEGLVTLNLGVPSGQGKENFFGNSLLRCDAVWSGRNAATFQRIVLPPSWFWKRGHTETLVYYLTTQRHILKDRKLHSLTLGKLRSHWEKWLLKRVTINAKIACLKMNENFGFELRKLFLGASV